MCLTSGQRGILEIRAHYSCTAWLNIITAIKYWRLSQLGASLRNFEGDYGDYGTWKGSTATLDHSLPYTLLLNVYINIFFSLPKTGHMVQNWERYGCTLYSPANALECFSDIAYKATAETRVRASFCSFSLSYRWRHCFAMSHCFGIFFWGHQEFLWWRHYDVTGPGPLYWPLLLS